MHTNNVVRHSVNNLKVAAGARKAPHNFVLHQAPAALYCIGYSVDHFVPCLASQSYTHHYKIPPRMAHTPR